MKIAIIYDSNSGNTKMLANSIKEVISKNDLVFFGCLKEYNDIEADLYILGSWTDKGSCSQNMGRFISRLKNKKIAYFGTAGYGGATDYYEKIFYRVKKFFDETNEIIDFFFCQGKMPLKVRERYVSLITQNPEDKNLQVSIDNFDKALSHPNQKDLDNVKLWIENVIKKIT